MNLFDCYNTACHLYPVVVSLPHSGTTLPPDIRSAMYPDVVLPNSDWFLPELYAFLQEMGVTMLCANASRYVVDLNRDKQEDLNGEDFWTRLVYTHNTFGRPLYPAPPSPGEVQRRIRLYYDPYHDMLEDLLRAKLNVYGRVLLLDLHSFAVDFVPGADEDICLSNYNGASSGPDAIDSLRLALQAQGYRVALNTVRGRYILRRYRELFGQRCDCIQMELRYSRYLEDRPFAEEEPAGWDEALFACARIKLKAAFAQALAAVQEDFLCIQPQPKTFVPSQH